MLHSAFEGLLESIQYICLYTNNSYHILSTVYMETLRELYFMEASKDFCGLIFTDYEVEYIVSLNHCFLCRIKILWN